MKGLEALQELKKQSENHKWLEQQFEKEWLNTIEKELKALEIIESYPHLVKLILDTALTYGKDNVKNYELLKEVLNNGK